MTVALRIDAGKGGGMRIGFIGLGSMGSAMVGQLLQAGHQVSVWNRTREAADKLQGVTVLPSPAAAFENEAVLTMLADDAAVRSVLLKSGALASAPRGCVHAMMATISPLLSSELAELHRQVGVLYAAAPVFGIPAVAAKGELNIMAAGDAEALEKLQPVFDVLGKKTWPLGADPQHANVAKIAGNLMITMAIEAMGEATALTESYGLKAGDFLDIVTNTMFASPSYQRYGGNIAKQAYEPGFTLKLGLKDVNLTLDAAKAKGTALPTAEIVRENMQSGVDQGMGAKDWSILAEAAQRRAGLKKN